MLSLTSVLLTSAVTSYGQQTGCDNEAGFDAFDFWPGEWAKTDNIAGNRAGSNSIQKM